ncbi:MAG: hypothetical protein JXA99_15690 [Candidatus Lokiarchaeota archaeon]|nr:hypothetical protein [Candidatus Lokiarchaeota archaeon]
MKKELFDKDEQIVYKIIKEYIKKKTINNLIDIINFITYRLKSNDNFNRNKIEIIVKNLVKKKKIVIGIRLVKDDVLELPIRRNIYEYIKNNPGANINDIKKEFSIGSNSIFWHLKIMEHFQFIRIVKYQSQKNIFRFESTPKDDILYIILKNEKIRSIINLLKNKGTPLRPTVLSELLSIHYSTLKKYLNQLVELNLIKKVNGEKKKRYKFYKDPF